MTGSVIFHSIFQVFVLSIVLLMSSTSGQLIKNADNDKSPRHHEPRHDDDQDEKTTGI